MNDHSHNAVSLLSRILFESSARVLFITGAGISVKSGIPLYRSDREKAVHDSKRASRASVEAQPRPERQPGGPDAGEVVVDEGKHPTRAGEAYVAISDNEDESHRVPHEPVVGIEAGTARSGEVDDAASLSSESSSYSAEVMAIWDAKLEAMAQKQTFLYDPRAWFKYFWFDTHHVDKFLKALPNESHVVIGLLCDKFRNRVKCITQNVDGLHQKGGCPAANLVEVHGRIGVYRCCRERCPNGSVQVAEPSQFSFMTEQEEETWTLRMQQSGNPRIKQLFEIEARKAAASYVSFPVSEHFPLPCCDLCRAPLMPMTLLFDETYQTHDFFNFDRACRWMDEADVFVFAGTSFSVFFTEHAIRLARYRQKTVFNINISREPEVFAGFADPTADPDVVPASHLVFNWDSGSEESPSGPGDGKNSAAPAADEDDDLALRYGTLSLNAGRGSSPNAVIHHVVAPADEALVRLLPSSYQPEIPKKLEAARKAHWKAMWEVR